MKLITLFVGNKLDHVVNFDPEEQQVAETYIIKREEITDLFAFYHGIGNDIVFSKKKKQDYGNEIIYQSNEGESMVHIKGISAKKTAQNLININVQLTDEEDATEIEFKDLDDAGLEFDTSNPALWIMTLECETKDPVIVNVSFQLKIKKRSYQQELKLCVAKEKDISDVVLDFGSEASQTGIFRRGERQTESDIRELFTEMENLLLTSSTTSVASSATTPVPATLSSSYVQRDNDMHFFKSVFFAKKQFTDADAGIPIPELDVSGKHVIENKVMKMLTTQMEAQDLLKNQGFIQIPNVKITQFGGVKQPKVGPNNDPILDYQDGYFYRASINRFILNALKNASTPCICLYVLMPNVYSQLGIIEHLRWIRKDVIDILDKNPVLAERIKAVELSAISESDASLLGAIRVIEDNNRRNEVVESGKYIIIDSGKGTLDYSAIKYETEPEPKVFSIYRSGIIGAGNSLTYAYFFALLRDYMSQAVNGQTSEEDIQSFIYENVLGRTSAGIAKGGGDIANLLKLMQAVEGYKIFSGSEDRRADDTINTVKSSVKHNSWKEVEMTIVTDFINKMIPVGTKTYKPLSAEAKEYVTKAINQIVDEVYANLSILKSMDYGKANGIIFAGRGFVLPEFKIAMKKKLEETGIADEELTYMRSDIAVNQKSVCLYIRTAIQEGHYNNHMASVPIVLRSTVYQNRAIEERRDFFSRLQEKLGLSSRRSESEVVQNVGNFFKVILDSREGSYHTPGSLEANGMVTGFTQNILNGDSLMIGGTKYRVVGVTGEITIFYSGEKIYYRYMDEHGKMKVKELTEDGVNLQNSPFLFGTLFPNVDVDNMVDVRLPFDPYAEKKRKEEAAEEQRKKAKKKKREAAAEQETGRDDKEDAKQNKPDEGLDPEDSDAGSGSATDRAHELANRV